MSKPVSGGVHVQLWNLCLVHVSYVPYDSALLFFFVIVVHRQGDTLAIDGSGWVFQLLEGQRVDHGGDYDLLHEAVVREVSRLRQVSS